MRHSAGGAAAQSIDGSSERPQPWRAGGGFRRPVISRTRHCRPARAATGAAFAHTATSPPSSKSSLSGHGAAAGGAMARMLLTQEMSSGDCLDSLHASPGAVRVGELRVYPCLDGPSVHRLRLRFGRPTANRADHRTDRSTTAARLWRSAGQRVWRVHPQRDASRRLSAPNAT